MSKPIFLVVSEDSRLRTGLSHDLERRYNADYRVLATTSVQAALAMLAECADQLQQVALVFADQGLGSSAVDFSLRCAPYPGCRRVLVIPRGDWSSQHPVIGAVAVGQVDFHLWNPWYPLERILYPAVSEFVSVWGRSQEAPAVPIRICGPRDSPRSHELRDVLTRASIPFWFFDEGSDEGRAFLEEVGATGGRLPVVALFTGAVLEDPTNADVVSTLGMKTRPDVDFCDVVIVGAGPSGLTAAVYAASEGLDTLLLEPVVPGGQAGTSALIRNYFGFHRHQRRGTHQSGHRTGMAVRGQLRAYAAGQRPACQGDQRVVRTEDGSEVTAPAIILATGVSWRRIGIPALDALIGAGVFYGAAGAEAKAMTGREAFIVGAGNSAGQAALHLARYADSVTMLVRRANLTETMSQYLIREIQAATNIAVRFNVEIVDGGGTGRLEWISLVERTSGRTSTVPANALFLMIGAEPHTDWLPDAIERDERGFLLTGRDLTRQKGAATGWPLERAPPPGNEHAGCLRGRRRPVRLRQAGGLRGR